MSTIETRPTVIINEQSRVIIQPRINRLDTRRDFLKAMAAGLVLTYRRLEARPERLYRSVGRSETIYLHGPNKTIISLGTGVNPIGDVNYKWWHETDGYEIIPYDSGTGDMIVYDSIWMNYPPHNFRRLHYSYVWPDWKLQY